MPTSVAACTEISGLCTDIGWLMYYTNMSAPYVLMVTECERTLTFHRTTKNNIKMT